METTWGRLSRPGAAAALAAGLALARWTVAAAADDPLAGGDSSYAHGDLAGARTAYASAVAEDPRRYAALWRLARVESELGEDAKGDERRRLVTAAVEHARAAVKTEPDSAQGHVWLSVALGRQALKEGARTRLALAREIKSEVDRSIAIDPRIGRAYHVRALWNREIARLNFFERAAANSVLGGVPKGATMENAVRDLERAIELEPHYVNHHLELGRTFAQLKRWDEARRELERADELPPTSNPRDARYQSEARTLLAKLPQR